MRMIVFCGKIELSILQFWVSNELLLIFVFLNIKLPLLGLAQLLQCNPDKHYYR